MPRALLSALAVLLVAAPPAWSAAPRAGSSLAADVHDGRGSDWHVQLEVDRTGTRLATVVVYSQRCKANGFSNRVALDADGRFELGAQPFTKGSGTWTVSGAFTAPTRASGTWAVERNGCTDGGTFDAEDAAEHLIGNPYEYAPERVRGDSPAARRARLLQARTRRNARRFDTVAKAREYGYELSTAQGCPGMHHARKNGTVMWGRTLDPTAPQALVYWCDSANRWTLAAFMYRADGDTRPSTYADILQWHKHQAASNWMTHIWLVPDPVSAFAACAPFPAFAAAGSFVYEPFRLDAEVDAPCSDTTA